jgi:hypothetical protein
VVQLVEARRYKPKDRGFDFLWFSAVRTIVLGSMQSLRKISKGIGNVQPITGAKAQRASRCIALIFL